MAMEVWIGSTGRVCDEKRPEGGGKDEDDRSGDADPVRQSSQPRTTPLSHEYTLKSRRDANARRG